MIYYHKSVLLHESINTLVTDYNGIYIDTTLGGGGHCIELLKIINKNGRVFAFDQDKYSIKNNNIKDYRLKIFCNNFKNLKKILGLNYIGKISGILADLGISSHQIDTPKRGFSIRFNEKLDMRMNNNIRISAKQIINKYSEKKLSKIFLKYGNLKNSKKIAKIIIFNRSKKKINTTFDLIKIFFKEKIFKKNKIKFFSKLFQSLRIEVNDEINSLKKLLIQSLKLLKIGGRIAIISYHSLESKLIKNFFKKKNKFKLINKKIITPNKKEIKKNSRSRSAQLRIAEKI